MTWFITEENHWAVTPLPQRFNGILVGGKRVRALENQGDFSRNSDFIGDYVSFKKNKKES
jgi:hypothetical protein